MWDNHIKEIWDYSKSCYPLSPTNEWASGGFKSGNKKNIREHNKPKPQRLVFTTNQCVIGLSYNFQNSNRNVSLQIVYRKACNLPVELENKACLAIKHLNINIEKGRFRRKFQLIELEEIRNEAYENARNI